MDLFDGSITVNLGASNLTEQDKADIAGIVLAQLSDPAVLAAIAAAVWDDTAAHGAGTKGKLLTDAKTAAQNAFAVSI